ncbi:MAG: GNAT family N-acetyltransferase [Bacteriovoracaceae bacterium]|nr:GNAT family N-acetyltransferase [Bacteriovoracaceae bacterium]
MNVKTLAEMPERLNECVTLIEKSFGYGEADSFIDDFSLLIDERNYQHCYFLIEEDEVVATLFTLPRTLTFKSLKVEVLFLGGISVKDENRGAGLFRTLLETILLLNPQYAFYLLWSDLAQLYEKFNFYEFGLIEEVDLTANEKQKLIKFNPENLKTLIEGHQMLGQSFMIPLRDEHDWHILLQSKSIKIFEDEKKNIYLINKGMDLKNICHEYHPEEAPPVNGYNNWRIGPHSTDASLRYMGFLRLGNLEKLNEFIMQTSEGRLGISAYENRIIEVIFDGEKYELGERDFIQGLWGPGQVEEWKDLVPKILIPGFDSI